MDGKVHRGDLSIHVVKTDQANDAERRGPKGALVGTGTGSVPGMDTPRYRRTASPSPGLVHPAARGKPVSFPRHRREGGRQTDQGWCGYGGGKRTPPWNGLDTGGHITRRASGRTSLRCGGPSNPDAPTPGTWHLMAASSAGAVSHTATAWHALHWRAVNETVRRLQARLVTATQAGQWHTVQAWQHLRTPSLRGPSLAVRRVTAHQGPHTPGVDTVLWTDPGPPGLARHHWPHRGERALPLRRVSLPQPPGTQRPLGRPTLQDRALQAWSRQALDPRADPHAAPHS